MAVMDPERAREEAEASRRSTEIYEDSVRIQQRIDTLRGENDALKRGIIHLNLAVLFRIAQSILRGGE